MLHRVSQATSISQARGGQDLLSAIARPGSSLKAHKALALNRQITDSDPPSHLSSGFRCLPDGLPQIRHPGGELEVLRFASVRLVVVRPVTPVL